MFVGLCISSEIWFQSYLLLRHRIIKSLSNHSPGYLLDVVFILPKQLLFMSQRSGIPNLCTLCRKELNSRESGDERGVIYWCGNPLCEELGYEHSAEYYIK